MADLMHQFEIKEIAPIKLGGYDISFTNSSLFMVISIVSIIVLFAICLRKRTLVPNMAQSIPESAYEFIYNIINDNIGKDGIKYISFLFSLFLFILVGNVLGLFPYSFTFTSHFATVGAISILGLLFNVFIGIKKRKWGYLRTFLPKGIPLWLAPLIVPIEIVSLLSKSFSLTVRLVMNMVVGHIVLKIFAGFVVMMGIVGVVPLLFDCGIIVFEIFIACLQAYIYTILSCIYLGAALHEH
jgi:F-type H+-transporting ATPase subunit a